MPSNRIRLVDTARISAWLLLCALNSGAVSGQTPAQQRIYGSSSVTTTTSAIAGYAKDSSTGGLANLANSPFTDRLEGGQLAIDGRGRFLFVLNPVSDSISMFQIDGATGALSEVPNSPFAVGATINPGLAPSLPISLATEPNGNFLYVGYANGDSGSTSAIVPFAIDSVNLQLKLTPQLALDFGDGAPIQMFTDPKGLRLYVGLGPAGNQLSQAAGTDVYSIDSVTGVLTALGHAGGGSDLGRAVAIDPNGRFFFDSWGQNTGFLDSGVISPVDGTSSANFTVDLGAGVFASLLLVESSGKYLYAETQNGLLIYAIDPVTGTLTLQNGPLGAFAFEKGTTVADPEGPYLYSLTRAGVDAFQVDPLTGNLAEVPEAPFALGSSTALGAQGLAISGSATQNISGPAAQLFPSSIDFGAIAVGQTSGTKIISLVNIGNQTMSVNAVSISGTNSGDFAKSTTCGAALPPNASCTFSVTFSPSVAGSEQSSLQITDDAAGSPQAALLSGAGVSAVPEVIISPANLNFGTILDGASAQSQSVQLTNKGSAPLHVSAVALSGSNPGDFSESNNCIANQLAPQTSCSIQVNFAPKTEGVRSASLLITDDAPNSPQSIMISGSMASPFQLGPAPTGAISAAVTAGGTATYLLQLVPGSGFAGSVTVSCVGAPAAASCAANPAALTVSGSSPVPFQVSVRTSGPSGGSAFGPFIPRPGYWFSSSACLIAGLTVLLLAKMRLAVTGTRVPIRFIGSMALLIVLFTSGCGSASPGKSIAAATTPGTSIITITAVSGNLTPQSLQLTLTVR